MSPSIPPTKRNALRGVLLTNKRLPLAAASADQRGFLVVYERPGTQLNLADVYELAGMAVVVE